MMATILAFPGVDLSKLDCGRDPRGQTLHIREHRGAFFLAVRPAGGWVHIRFSSAIRARAYAGDLCHGFPRIYRRVIDETRSTRQSLGEIMAGAPSEGDAA